MGPFHTLTSTLGTGLALYLSYKVIDTAWLYMRPSSLHRYLYTDEDRRAWAMVTGSSSGIGKALAFELAGHGFSIVLHGRNPSKLEGVRTELRSAYPDVEIRVIIADAARAEAVDFDSIRDEVADLHLTVLVNCAGAGPTPTFGTLDSYSCAEILRNLHLNIAFPTLLTAALLPVLRRRHGPFLIINIGSVSDDGFPLISFYSAGKTATHALHQALAREAVLDNWGADVEIISHRVAAVTGVSHSQAPVSLLTPHSRTIARAVLARTGCGRKSVVPYWPHALAQAFLAVLPTWVFDGIVISALREESLGQYGKIA